MNIFWIIVAIAVVGRIIWRITGKKRGADSSSAKPKKPLSPLQKKFFTIWVFFIINMRRLFRDRLALFFTFLFPLIFLFVFGSLSHSNSVSLKVAIINESHSSYARQFVNQAEHQKTLKVDSTVNNYKTANEKMGRGELDATIELPPSFGAIKNKLPSGQAIVHYTEKCSGYARCSLWRLP